MKSNFSRTNRPTVAQICNLLYRRFAIGSVFPEFLRVLRCARPAEYNSAIQQITNLRYGRQAAFTMIEIALCLAIIGFALVAIIGVLPMGMQVQKDNRLETIINQDATYLIEAIRSGARGMDDLTNYVVAITNTVTDYNSQGLVSGSTTFGYTYYNSTVNGAAAAPPFPINNGQRIIGLLSTPKYHYLKNNSFRSNHVVAYMRAISGSAVEKATNQAARDFSFAYRVTPEIIPYTSYDRNETNFNLRTLTDQERLSRSNFWRYAMNQQQNLYEMRLLFRWPLLPNGGVGNGRQVYRTTVSSAIVTNTVLNKTLYFFEPRSYVRVP